MRALACLVLAGCIDVASTYRCREDTDCTRGGIGGTCEPSGACSFADPDCGANGRRYDETAGMRAGVCVADLIAAAPLGHVDLGSARDVVRGTCAPEGAREAFIELQSDRPQALVIDSVPMLEPFGATTTSAFLSLRKGSCGDAEAMEIACAPPPCGDTYSRLITPVDAGRYCLVVEAPDPSTETGTIQLRALPARRAAQILPPIENVEMTAGASTCGQGPVENQCGPPTDAAVFLAPLCPGQLVSATVSSTAPLDAVLSIRHGVPQEPAQGACVNDAAGQGDETIQTPPAGASDPHYLVVSSIASCGALSLRYTIKR